MSDLQRYLAEEIALDCRDGLIGRREAMRRLGLLGVSSAASSTLLAGCKEQSPGRPAGGGGAAPAPASPSSPSPAAAAVTFAGPEGRALQGAFAAAERPRGAILVIHENRGLTEHFRRLAGRFAGERYAAL